MDIKADIKIKEEYSPRKKNTKTPAECSVIKPATNSDSHFFLLCPVKKHNL
jgi:hypothetical protein